MFGQVRIEFIFGVVVFGILIFFIASQLNSIHTSIATDSKLDTLKTKALNTITLLVRDSGDPINWESNPPVKRVGLSFESQPYNLSKPKITALDNDCGLLENLNLGGYRLTIYDSSTRLLFCGYVGVSPITTTVTKSVLIEGQYGNITLEVW